MIKNSLKTNGLLCLLIFFNTSALNEAPPTILQKTFARIGHVKNLYGKITPRVKRTFAVIGLLTLPFIKPLIMRSYQFLINYHFAQQEQHYVHLDKIKPIISSQKLDDLCQKIPKEICTVRSYCQQTWLDYFKSYFRSCSRRNPYPRILIYSKEDAQVEQFMQALGAEIPVFARYAEENHKHELPSLYKVARTRGKSVVWFDTDYYARERRDTDFFALVKYLQANRSKNEQITTIVTANGQLPLTAHELVREFIVIDLRARTDEQKREYLKKELDACNITRSQSCEDLLKTERELRVPDEQLLKACEARLAGFEKENETHKEEIIKAQKEQTKLKKKLTWPYPTLITTHKLTSTEIENLIPLCGTVEGAVTTKDMEQFIAQIRNKQDKSLSLAGNYGYL